jgi:hypothetical protein
LPFSLPGRKRENPIRLRRRKSKDLEAKLILETRLCELTIFIPSHIYLDFFVMPDLIRHPVFSWIPAAVYPALDAGRE